MFKIKPGETFTQETSPNIANRPFTVTAVLEKLPAQGVIAAQGGSNHGWSLFLKDNKAYFTVRREGKTWSAKILLSKDLIPKITATVGDGIRIEVTNGRNKLSNSVDKPGSALLTTQPLEPLEIGQDTGGLVGDYKPDFKLTAPLKSLKIEIK